MKAKAEIAAMFTVTGNHPSSTMFGAGATLWGCRSINAKQTIAIAVKYPMRSAAIVISSPPVWNDAGGTGEKLCPTSHRRLRVKWNYSRRQKTVDVLLTQAQPALPKSLIDQEQSGEGGLIREPLDAPVPGEPK